MTQIIGLLGGRGAGKDTAAAYLADKLCASRFAIVDEMKYLVKRVYGFTDAQLWGTQALKETVDERVGISPRKAMEVVGDALNATYGNQFQVLRVLEQISLMSCSFTVVSDVRFAHEADVLRGAGAHLIRLQYAPGLKQWPSSHRSEQEWQTIPVDVDVSPGHGLRELYAGLDQALHVLGISPDVIRIPVTELDVIGSFPCPVRVKTSAG